MIKKYSNSLKSIKNVSPGDVKQIVADEAITGRLEKLARDIKKISKKSDDFLYFSIIFLKAAESAILDDNGLPKKTASGEVAWGYFDDNCHWHGNVKPHRNNNSDIFPESELKKAASKWIGLPLCKDHKSDSVDGIRGIILDTHYDEKFKQVVGLCALDKVNYPDLARKVETGMVRYGSMGTAVERSICSTCYNVASSPDQYCEHVKNRTAHGEINFGLNPIEYSLVVQPAEPKAILLKCIASLQTYRDEFQHHGISKVDDMLGSLSEPQARHLDSIMSSACGEDGCSLEKRASIITSFFKNNKNLNKFASREFTTPDDVSAEKVAETVRNLTESAEKASGLGDQKLADELLKKVYSYVSSGYKPESEDSFESMPDSSLMQDSIANSSVQDEVEPILKERPDTYEETDAVDASLTAVANNTKSYIKNILEEFMNKSRLNKRAEMRRKLAYMQGGAEGREPNTFKEETFSQEEDKHMKQTGAIGQGDKEKKEKMSRAELNQRAIKRTAYMQGGSEGKEPSTFKAEVFSHDHDKQMHQTGAIGSDDMKIKEHLKRANYYRGLTKSSAYSGPKLKTAVKIGSTKSDSKLQVLAGDNVIISVAAQEIFGDTVNENWSWLVSSEYGRQVCNLVRTAGVLSATNILKNAQEMTEEMMPGMEEAPAEPAPEMPAEPAMEGPAMEEPAVEEPAEEEDSSDPAADAEARLSEMEGLIDEVRDLIDQIKDSKMADVDIHVDVGGDKEGSAEQVALAAEVLGQLKKVADEADQSADELAMIAETYDNFEKVSSSDKFRFKKLAASAVKDSDEIIGESRATIKIAKSVIKSLSKVAYEEDDVVDMPNMDELDDLDHADDEDHADDMTGHGHHDAQDAQEDLIAEAVLLRRNRREQILKSAEQRFRQEEVKQEVATEKPAVEKVAHVEEPMNRIKQKLAESLTDTNKKEADQNFKIKIRRAYDIALDMQKKGLISHTKTALDKQVDEIMNFDDPAFESFKRSIANLKAVQNVKTASSIGSLNVGIKEEVHSRPANVSKNILASMWDK